jgi:hypothetical protein
MVSILNYFVDWNGGNVFGQDEQDYPFGPTLYQIPIDIGPIYEWIQNIFIPDTDPTRTIDPIDDDIH